MTVNLEARLRSVFVVAHPAEAARALESMPAAESAEAMLDLPVDAFPPLIRCLAPYYAANALALLPVEKAAGALDGTWPDAAAAVLRAMPSARRSEVLGALSSQRQKTLRRLLRYAEGTAGALMDPAVLSVDENVLVADALEQLRLSPQHALYYLYVLRENRELMGVVNMKQLMSARPNQLVGMIAVRNVASIPARASWESIVVHPAWKRFHALPVVDRDGSFVGAIRYESVRQLEERWIEARAEDHSAETASALGELYGLGLRGLFEWAASAVLGSSDRKRGGS